VGRVVGAGAVLVLLAVLNVVSAWMVEIHPASVAAMVSADLLPASAVGAPFKPSRPTGTPVVSVASLDSRAACTQRSRAWATPTGPRIQIELTGCSLPGVVEAAQTRLDQTAKSAGGSAVSNIPYAVETAPVYRGNGTGYQARRVVFRNDNFLVIGELLTHSLATRAELSTFWRVMRQQQDDLPDSPGPGLDQLPATALTRTAFKLLAEGFVILIVALLFASWAARRRMIASAISAPPCSSDRIIATDVHGQARRVAWLARGRFTLQLIGLYIICGPALALPRYRVLLICAGAAIFLVVTAVRPRGVVRPLRERMKTGILTGQRTIRAVALAMVSLVAAWLVPALSLLGFLLWSLRRSGIIISYGRIDPSLLAHGPLLQAIGSVPLPVLSADCLVIAAAAAITVPISYRAARRIATLTADEVSRQKKGDYILYLRNFADDDIQMPTSRLSRNSLVERIAVYRLERFEEVLVRHLSHYAPVIAVDPPGIYKQPIGAARMALNDGNWKAHVERHMAEAVLIVVGAAPQRWTAGLSWELSELSRQEALPKTLLVLPPLLPSALRARWEIFTSMAASYQLPSDLSSSADHHLVLRPTGRGTWRTWHSQRRTEWHYLTSLHEAMQDVRGGTRQTPRRESTAPP